MPGQSIFSEDWRDCLKSHYMYVVREQDVKTEHTLRGVMHNVGFRDDELNELRVLATMHVDDVGTDFVPDPELLEALADDVGASHDSPLPADTPLEETAIEEDLVEAAGEEEPPKYDESGPQQLTMF